ncbi:MAG: hypothetical protein GXP49_02070 [Deltaproteobacteria bacterium]|nr:hypothetical protein [Deltaproteobacteria bacterium]
MKKYWFDFFVTTLVTSLFMLIVSFPVPADAQGTTNDAKPAIMDCNKALQRFEDLVGTYISLLTRGQGDEARLQKVRKEIRALDNKAGRFCLRYYARGIELYDRMKKAEKEAGRQPLLQGFPNEKKTRENGETAKSPPTGLFQQKAIGFVKPKLAKNRPEMCLNAPMKPGSSLVIGLTGLALGTAVGFSLLNFDGSTEHGFGYAFLLASTTFAPAAGHFRAGESWLAWLLSGLRAGAGGLAVAGISRGNDSTSDKWMTYGGLISLGILVTAGLVDGVLAVHRLNEKCGFPGGKLPDKK